VAVQPRAINRPVVLLSQRQRHTLIDVWQVQALALALVVEIIEHVAKVRLALRWHFDIHRAKSPK
jgi:hypothetical protein